MVSSFVERELNSPRVMATDVRADRCGSLLVFSFEGSLAIALSVPRSDMFV